ncbi:hypothetical protein [Nocardioides sp. Leaf285]|uniref:hypothetical protein n=1 Tax=Nocardioides sp. Leaf285 TaxID=1736322 RepID=UPI000702C611|nr:hypothetical protein [Nocardioides sp. Leaf285]KQP62818.1 hypothetical protein ASF47_17555 [Nocardioides sp. Leaf285]
MTTQDPRTVTGPDHRQSKETLMSSTRNFPGTPTMRAFSAAVVAKVPICFESHPGQGKSSKITATGEKSGYLVKCVVGSVREATDFLGLPVEQSDPKTGQARVSNVPPDFAVELRAAAKPLLFLDEINTAMESTRKAMLRLIQEGYAGDFYMGPDLAIVAAQNPPETATGGTELDPAIANRMMHLAWAFDADEWLRGISVGFENLDQPGIDDLASGGTEADKARASSIVAGYIHHAGQHLAPTPPEDPIEAGKAWPSPRSWHNLARVLAHVDAADEEAMTLVVQGLVGEGVSKDFFAWLALADLHNPQEVMDDPSIVDWRGERPDRIFGLLSGIEALAIFRADAATWEKAINVMTVCAENGRPDAALPSTNGLLGRRPQGTRLTERTRTAFADLLTRTRHGYAEQAPLAQAV